MIQLRQLFAILLLILAMGLAANAQTYTRNGNTFTSAKSVKAKTEPIKTKFTWKDSKGKEYPVYISAKGSCFVIKVSAKTGKEYKNYLGPEISQQICKELNIKYNGKKGNNL